MTKRVMVELDYPSSNIRDDSRVIQNILGEGYKVFFDCNIFVDVSDSDNAVEDVWQKLQDLAVGCICYDWDDESHLD